MSEVDVLIVGAGPVGVTLALELALQKISFRVIDKEPTRSDKSRALVVQPRTQELLNRHGATKELVSRGGTLQGLSFTTNRKRCGQFDLFGLDLPDTQFSSPLVISQCKTEKFLDDCLAKHGYEAERPVAAKAIAQDKDGVTVTLEKPTGEEKIRVKYVVGCDGAHSIVRHATPRFGFRGAAYQQDFILCDAYIKDSNIDRSHLHMCLGNGMLAMFPLEKDMLRLVGAGTSIDKDEEPKLEHFQQMLDTMAPPGSGSLYNPVWLTRFHLHHRGVDTYRDGRLFVAGDAAHIHSPAGGQGMNTGMQDSINLGWKLARVLRGQAGDTLLDSYHAERHPVGQNLLHGSDRAFTFLASTNWLFATARNFLAPWILPWVTSSNMVRQGMFGFVSEFDVAYRQSPIVGTASGFNGPLRGGDRLRDAEIRRGGQDGEMTHVQEICVGPSHHFLVFVGTGENTTPDAQLETTKAQVLELTEGDAEVHVIFGHNPPKGSGFYDPEGKAHEQYGLTKAGYIFVRPDGYVGHIGHLSSLGELLSLLKSS